MNIFILDEDPFVSVAYHVNTHCVKMPLEMAQMLCTAHRVLSSSSDENTQTFPDVFYKKTHINHPCSIWVRKTRGNYEWAYTMFYALASEFEYRYEKPHLSWEKLKNLINHFPDNIDPSMEITPFALAMPDEYKIKNDAVASYRNYYNGTKQHLFFWGPKRIRPIWAITND